VAPVERLRVDAVQDLHSGGELLASGLDHEVVVVAHQAERVAAPGETHRDAREHREKDAAVVVVAEDRDLPGAACADVEDAVLGQHLGARRPRHATTVQTPPCAGARCGTTVTLLIRTTVPPSHVRGLSRDTASRDSWF
jgi:hypothetical protein